jgi:succinate dehydrogenase hydrophobic anchor subunit
MMVLKQQSSRSTHEELHDLHRRITELEQTIHDVCTGATALKHAHSNLNQVVMDYRQRREAREHLNTDYGI